jgi:hypothetical protein
MEFEAYLGHFAAPASKIHPARSLPEFLAEALEHEGHFENNYSCLQPVQNDDVFCGYTLNWQTSHTVYPHMRNQVVGADGWVRKIEDEIEHPYYAPIEASYPSHLTFEGSGNHQDSSYNTSRFFTSSMQNQSPFTPPMPSRPTSMSLDSIVESNRNIDKAMLSRLLWRAEDQLIHMPRTGRTFPSEV